MKRKNKKDKRIEKIAEQIVKIEKEMNLGKSDLSNEEKIENILQCLSFEDLIKIDNYIISNNLLTK